jgi:hypothetical protein
MALEAVAAAVDAKAARLRARGQDPYAAKPAKGGAAKRNAAQGKGGATGAGGGGGAAAGGRGLNGYQVRVGLGGGGGSWVTGPGHRALLAPAGGRGERGFRRSRAPGLRRLP